MGTISTQLCFSSSSSSWTTKSKSTLLNPQSTLAFHFPSGAVLSTFAPPPPRIRDTRSTASLFPLHFSPRASSSSSSTVDYREEATTKVKFPTSLCLPGCSTSLSLLGTGYREKVFAIIGVKVYAAGLYVDQSIIKELDAWKGRSALEIQDDPSLFTSIFQVPLEKSLDIILVRDVDGKTFWDALNEALSPRIKSPTPVDETALSTFRDIFQGRSLKKGTLIFLTWLNPTKMLVCVSSEGSIPSDMDATIESTHVPMALFDVFFGSEPVSPSLKASVSNGLASLLK